MVQLGAKPIIELGLGDDQHALGVEGAFQPWRRNLWQKIFETSLFKVKICFFNNQNNF